MFPITQYQQCLSHINQRKTTVRPTKNETCEIPTQVRNAARCVGEDRDHGFEAVVQRQEDGFKDVEDGTDEGTEGVDNGGHGCAKVDCCFCIGDLML